MATLQNLLDCANNLEYAKIFEELDNLDLASKSSEYSLLKKEFLHNEIGVFFNDRLKVQIRSAFQSNSNRENKTVTLSPSRKVAFGLISLCSFTLFAFVVNSFGNYTNNTLKVGDVLTSETNSDKQHAVLLIDSTEKRETTPVQPLLTTKNTSNKKLVMPKTSNKEDIENIFDCNQSDINSFKEHLYALVEDAEFDKCFACIKNNQYIDYKRTELKDISETVTYIIAKSPHKLPDARRMTNLLIESIKKK